MKKFIKILFLLTLPLVGFAQQKPTYELIGNYESKGNFVVVDHLGFHSVVGDYEFNRCQSHPPLEFKYSDKSLSTVTSIDLTDPLKILVFYKDLSKIVMVDNTLSPSGNDIYLEEYELGQCILAATSFNNGIWLYDQLTFQLIRLDRGLNKVTETNNIVQLVGHEIDPNFMVENTDWLYVNDPENGILVFDIYGSYYKTIPIKGLTRFQVNNRNIYYLQNNKYFVYSQETLDTTEIILPEGVFKSVQIAGNKLFLLSDTSLGIYSFK